ncbi:MAG: hypothetical protein EOM87_08345, partial [Clostridia bacterium]|nr:hypothetical protein [Clostridia bacterium]
LKDKDIKDFTDKLTVAENRGETFKELSHNPLLLTAMLTIYAEKNEFPESKAEIYERCFELITSEREEDKQLQLPEALTKPLSVQAMVRQLAFTIHKGGDANQAIESYIRDTLSKNGIRKEEDELSKIRESFFKYLEQRSLYSAGRFLHETFKEYLAAKYIHSRLSIKTNSEICELEYIDTINVEEAPIKALTKLYCANLEQWAPVIEFFLILTDYKHKLDFSPLSVILTDLLKAENYKKWRRFGYEHEVYYRANYDILCRAVTQLANHRQATEALIITDILKRTATESRNPFEDLFYYLLKYDMRSGLTDALSLDKLKDKSVRPIVYLIIDKLILCYEAPLAEKLKQLKSDYAEALKLSDKYKDELKDFSYKYAVTCRRGYRLFDGKNDFEKSLKIGVTMAELTNITIIKDDAFSGCTGLTSVIIPDSVNSIGNYAFEACIGLTSVIIPEYVKSIGSYAFEDCTGLTSVTIPDSVKHIGDNAFWGCTGLTDIIVNDGSKHYKSQDGVLFSKDITELILFPQGKKGSYILPNSVNSIGRRAFSKCSGLTSVTIPYNVKHIGDWAFDGCTGLTDIIVNNDSKHYKSQDGVLFSKDMTELILYP